MNFDVPVPLPTPQITPLSETLAQPLVDFFKNVSSTIQDIKHKIEPNKEVVVYSNGPSGQMVVDQLIFRRPNFLCVVGRATDGTTVIAMTHVQNLHLTCHIVNVQPDQPKRNPIGFKIE